ncbi:hypothetical protein NHM07_21090, partial [Bacillus subtilis]|uniref:TMEM164 family acyltransferase n=1 Tax=Bacillus subtilis TaxID=1423 RepID=UPI0040578172|nr:hypothetical protein [Bacillus subtilis]
ENSMEKITRFNSRFRPFTCRFASGYAIVKVKNSCTAVPTTVISVIGTYRMGQRSLWVTVLLVNVYGVCIFLIDRWLGANYMYLT